MDDGGSGKFLVAYVRVYEYGVLFPVFRPVGVLEGFGEVDEVHGAHASGIAGSGLLEARIVNVEGEALYVGYVLAAGKGDTDFPSRPEVSESVTLYFAVVFVVGRAVGIKDTGAPGTGGVVEYEGSFVDGSSGRFPEGGDGEFEDVGFGYGFVGAGAGEVDGDLYAYGYAAFGDSRGELVFYLVEFHSMRSHSPFGLQVSMMTVPSTRKRRTMSISAALSVLASKDLQVRLVQVNRRRLPKVRVRVLTSRRLLRGCSVSRA